MSPSTKDSRVGYINEHTYIDFNKVDQIRDCKDTRHRAKEQFIKEIQSQQITKENSSKEKYQLYKIMERTDKLTKPEENASVRVKLDQLDIK